MINSMKQKVLVCYLITKFDNEHALKDFIYNYKINNSGLNHDLLICFKLLNMNQINLFKNILNEINYVEFFDNSILNDYDLGSYQRVAKAFSSRHIFFLNSYSYPVCDLWLKKIVDNYENNSVVATSASYGSLLSSLKLKKFYKIIGYYLKLFDYKKKFNPFPNPHIRTTGFFIKASDYLSYMSDKTIKSKEDAWCIESGKKSLTNYFKNHGFKIFVVNSNGDKFAEDKWKLSETFNYLNQEKSIISDKHIRKYLELKGNEKKKITFNTWGVY
jgi:hypothetical protein